jgi:hypothetical protein
VTDAGGAIPPATPFRATWLGCRPVAGEAEGERWTPTCPTERDDELETEPLLDDDEPELGANAADPGDDDSDLEASLDDDDDYEDEDDEDDQQRALGGSFPRRRPPT